MPPAASPPPAAAPSSNAKPPPLVDDEAVSTAAVDATTDAGAAAQAGEVGVDEGGRAGVSHGDSSAVIAAGPARPLTATDAVGAVLGLIVGVLAMLCGAFGAMLVLFPRAMECVGRAVGLTAFLGIPLEAPADGGILPALEGGGRGEAVAAAREKWQRKADGRGTKQEDKSKLLDDESMVSVAVVDSKFSPKGSEYFDL